MIGSMTLSEAAIAYGGTLLFPDTAFTAVSTDSRNIVPGELYVALKGDKFDGHDFIQQVGDSACGFIVSESDKSIQKPQWVVADTTTALGQLARLNRKRFSGKLIGLTGSSGKTTVKEMIAAILALRGPTLSTRGNLNNHIGVPKTLFELTAEHRFAVIEMGASGPGEIAYLCQLAQPNIVLVNNVMPAHIEGFGSESEIAHTKGAVYSTLGQDGTAIINLDDTWSAKWQGMAGDRKVMTFSIADKSADIFASRIDLSPIASSRFVISYRGRTAEINLPVPGKHNIANALAAASCALAAGLSLVDVAAGLANVKSVKGRLQSRAGLSGAVVLDDSYNANPGSVKAAIDVLAQRPGKRILVLGDMAELGSLTKKSHQEVGRYASEAGIDELFVTGQFAEFSSKGFGSEARVFLNKEELAKELKEQLSADTTVLVKGSRSAAMEEVVAQISVEENHASMAS